MFIEGDIVKISDDTAVHHKSDFTESQKSLMIPKLKERAAKLGIDFEKAKVDAGERYLWGCRERSLYIEGNYRKHKPISSGNLFRRK